MNRMTLGHMMAVGLLVMGMGHSFANPTGCHFAAGSGSFNRVGDLTKFVHPSEACAALTRHDKFARPFLFDSLHFTGRSPDGVQNLGKIKGLGGDIYLIGKRDDNRWTIDAHHGIAGQASGDDVLFNPCGQEHVFVSPSRWTNAGPGQTSNHDKGPITDASFGLKGANGNVFALAINHEGTFRATDVTHHDGRTFLTGGDHSFENTGTFDSNFGHDTYDGHDGRDDHDTYDGHDGRDDHDTYDGHDFRDDHDGYDGHDFRDDHDGFDGHDFRDDHDGFDGHDFRDDHDGFDFHDGYDFRNDHDGHDFRDHHHFWHDRRECREPTNVTPTSKNFFIDPSVISFEASGFDHLSSHSQFYISDPGAPPHDTVSVDALTGGALNDGAGHNIAAGSSTSGAPGPKRLVIPGNGIWNIFSGTVHSAPPPAFVAQQLKFNLSPEVLAHLHEILFGNP